MAIHITGTTDVPDVGLPGHMPAGQSAPKVSPKVVDESAGIPAGVVVLPGTDPESDVSLPDASDWAADVDYFLSSQADLGDASGTSYSLTDFDGLAAAGVRLNPPRKVTLVLGSDANWDATTATVTATLRGVPLSGSITIPDAGNATATSDIYTDDPASVVVTIPVQSGDAPGSIGLAAVTADTPLKVTGVTLRSEGQTMPFSAGVADTADDFGDDESVAVMERGRVLVASEDAATADDPVYVRMVAGASEQLGAVRSTPDSTDCLIAEGARFRTSASGSNNLCEIELP